MTAPKLLCYASLPHAHEVQGSNTHGCFKRQLGVALVPVLSLCRRPPAVAGFVPALVVNPVEACFWRAVAHVSVEVFKTQPPLAHRYAPAPVSWEAFVGWRGATLDHAIPRAVRRRFVQTVGLLKFLCCFFCKAPTRAHKSGLKAVNRSGLLVPAVANAAPNGNAPSHFSSWRNRGELSKPLIGDVFYHA